MKPIERILRAVYSAVWAIQPEKLEAIVGFLELRAHGGAASAETIAEIRAANEISAARAQKVATAGAGAVAVLPLYGLITQRSSFVGDFSGPGGTSVQSFTQQFREAVNDPNVKAICDRRGFAWWRCLRCG
jgi:ClpP class serine protease